MESIKGCFCFCESLCDPSTTISWRTSERGFRVGCGEIMLDIGEEDMWEPRTVVVKIATCVFFFRLTMLSDMLVILTWLSSTLVIAGRKKGFVWRRFGSTSISSAPDMLKGNGRLKVSPGCTSVRLETETRLCLTRWSS